MITLYGKTGCQYTAKALAALDAHGLSFIKKNIADPAVVDELIAEGGKKLVPFIIDGDVKMYESDDIVKYIEDTYGKAEGSELHVQFAGGNCGSGNCKE